MKLTAMLYVVIALLCLVLSAGIYNSFQYPKHTYEDSAYGGDTYSEYPQGAVYYDI
jgi:hypothetical protein